MGFLDELLSGIVQGEGREWEQHEDWYARGPLGATSTRGYTSEMKTTMERDIAESARFGWEAELVSSLDAGVDHEPSGILTGRISFSIGGAPRGTTVMSFARRRDIQPAPGASASSG